MTAVTLVDFRRQKAMVTGDIRRATPVDIAPNHPKKKMKKIKICYNYILKSSHL